MTTKTGKRKPAARPSGLGPPKDPGFGNVDALDGRCRESFWAGKPSEALEACDALFARIEESAAPGDPEGDRLRGVVELRRGAARRRSGDLEAAKRSAERAVSVCPACPDLVASGLSLLSEIHLLLGQPLLAEIVLERTGEYAKKTKAPVPAWATCQRGRIAWAEGRVDEAYGEFLRAQEIARRNRQLPAMAQIAGNVGMCLMALGRLAEARTWLNRALEHARTGRLRIVEAIWLAGLGRLELAEGNRDQAAALARSALSLARARDLPLVAFRARWLLHYLEGLGAADGPEPATKDALAKLGQALSGHEGDREVRDLLALLDSRPHHPASVAAFTEGCDPVLPPPSLD